MGDMSTKPAASSLNPEYADIVDTPSLREVTSREHKYCGHVLDVTVEKYLLSPHGPELTRDVVGMPGAVAVATLDEHDRILLLNQYRHPVRMNLWEVPAGLLDIEGEDPLAAAQRELAEEADLEAKTWHTLIDYYTTRVGPTRRAASTWLGVCAVSQKGNASHAGKKKPRSPTGGFLLTLPYSWCWQGTSITGWRTRRLWRLTLHPRWGLPTCARPPIAGIFTLIWVDGAPGTGMFTKTV